MIFKQNNLRYLTNTTNNPKISLANILGFIIICLSFGYYNENNKKELQHNSLFYL